eukprot:snap_masked-scaffold_59-processed-gene-0.81-mRNA-1 protein AED:1.00 eAED:1.00 QI:0/0/0/0/1/1/2/0/69
MLMEARELKLFGTGSKYEIILCVVYKEKLGGVLFPQGSSPPTYNLSSGRSNNFLNFIVRSQSASTLFKQ